MCLIPVGRMSSTKTASEQPVVAVVAEEGRGWRTRRSCRHRETVESASAGAGNSGEKVSFVSGSGVTCRLHVNIFHAAVVPLPPQ